MSTYAYSFIPEVLNKEGINDIFSLENFQKIVGYTGVTEFSNSFVTDSKYIFGACAIFTEDMSNVIILKSNPKFFLTRGVITFEDRDISLEDALVLFSKNYFEEVFYLNELYIEKIIPYTALYQIGVCREENSCFIGAHIYLSEEIFKLSKDMVKLKDYYGFVPISDIEVTPGISESMFNTIRKGENKNG